MLLTKTKWKEAFVLYVCIPIIEAHKLDNHLPENKFVNVVNCWLTLIFSGTKKSSVFWQKKICYGHVIDRGGSGYIGIIKIENNSTNFRGLLCLYISIPTSFPPKGLDCMILVPMKSDTYNPILWGR